MSEELEKRLATLEAKPKPSAVAKWAQIIVAFVIVIFGTGASYQVTKSQVAVLQAQVGELKKDRDKKEVLWKAETDKLKADVVTLKVKGAGDDQWRKTTTATLEKIETKLDNLAKRKPQ